MNIQDIAIDRKNEICPFCKAINKIQYSTCYNHKPQIHFYSEYITYNYYIDGNKYYYDIFYILDYSKLDPLSSDDPIKFTPAKIISPEDIVEKTKKLLLWT